MNILHIVYSCVPGEFRGGVARVAEGLARGQARLGHRVTVLTSTLNSFERTDLQSGDEVETPEGVVIRYFDVESTRSFRSPELLAAARFEAGRHEVVHAHNTYLALNRYADEVSQESGIPAFYHPHGALDPLVVNRGLAKSFKKQVYIRLVERPLLDRAAGIFANTEAERDQLQGWGVRAPVHIMRNGISPPTLGDGTALRQQLGIPEAALAVVFIGRIVPKKAVDVLVDAVGRVGDEAHAVLVGNPDQDPAYTEVVREAARAAGAEDRVHWLGFLDDAAKADVFAMADVFSHLTESEGMALSVLESMAAGLPTLVSPECYMQTAAEAGAVLEIPRDPAALADALAALAADPDRRTALGEAARRYALAHHDWEAVASEVVAHYEQSLS